MISDSHRLRSELLRLLADGQFHSGERLGVRFGISRAAIGKHIQALQQQGIDLFRVPGKGYRLAAPLNLLQEERLRQALPDVSWLLFDELPSTNQYLMEHLGQLPHGSVCLSESQTAGKGRRGRQWISPFASNLYYSLYWRMEQGLAAAMGLSLAVAVAVCRALAELEVTGVGVKWPNDLLVKGRKLAGILVEMQGLPEGPCHLVIGIGINVAMNESDARRIDQPWIDLSCVTQQGVERNRLAIALTRHLRTILKQFEDEGLSRLRQEWALLDAYAGQPVTLSLGEKQLTGICRGIDDQGALLLETGAGIRAFSGGEISLRGRLAPPW